LAVEGKKTAQKRPPKTLAKKPAKKKPATKKARTKKSIWQWVLAVFLWGILGLGGLLGYYAYTLPDIDAVLAEKQPPITTLLAADSSILATMGGGHDEWLQRPDIPDVLVNAVLAIEDRRFYSHGGLDYLGVLRAMVANVMAGDLIQGGSTLTQQLAKNMFLTPERTLKRKLQEAMLAFWLERHLSKDDILVEYLNRVYLGSGTYGVEAASKRYFSHSARSLSLGEAALVAGLLKAPSRYSPLSNRASSFQRMQVVLGAMLDGGFITQQVREAEPNPVIKGRSGVGGEKYFTDWVMAALPDLVDQSSGDLVVHTTYQPTAQQAATRALQDALTQWGTARDVSQGAVLVMSTQGAVRAMVGGKSYGESEYNRATTALRQPGSAFKLFVYLTAFEAGLSPKTMMRDSPFILENWQPQNYNGEFAGAMNLEQAFARSINTIAVKLAEQANRSDVILTAQRLGITSKIIRQPSLALGTSEVRLLELTSAYGVIASGGMEVRPFGVQKVTTRDGAVIYERRSEPLRIVERKHVRYMQQIMTEAVQTGTGKAAQLPAQAAAGKTGTSQDFRDAWFIGYAGDLVTGVWVGNDDATPMKRVTGGFIPARIWRAVMQDL
jgi:penicillin-binding protein 1A